MIWTDPILPNMHKHHLKDISGTLPSQWEVPIIKHCGHSWCIWHLEEICSTIKSASHYQKLSLLHVSKELQAFWTSLLCRRSCPVCHWAGESRQMWSDDVVKLSSSFRAFFLSQFLPASLAHDKCLSLVCVDSQLATNELNSSKFAPTFLLSSSLFAFTT